MEVRSEGCNDVSKGTRCGQAYILVNGKDVSRHRRGHNVAVLDYSTGKLLICIEGNFSSVLDNSKLRS